jgi:hypothetical protein
MASQAKERLAAVGKHLRPDGGLPPVTKVAGPSAGPRLAGKVAIITGNYLVSLSFPTYGKDMLILTASCNIQAQTQS